MNDTPESAKTSSRYETKFWCIEPPPLGEDNQMCRVCGCTSLSCAGCIMRTGQPCSWIGEDLCSACQDVGDNQVPLDQLEGLMQQFMPKLTAFGDNAAAKAVGYALREIYARRFNQVEPILRIAPDSEHPLIRTPTQETPGS